MKNRIVQVFLCLAVLGLGGCARRSEIRVNGVRPAVPALETESAAASAVMPETELAVYVCGAVLRPGVYYFPSGARVQDAVEAAGGFTREADTQWLNLALRLSDSQMLRVYTAKETALMKEQGSGGDREQKAFGQSGQNAGSGSDGKLDLNTASREQLMTLPGIGESKADAIIRYREENGSFSSAEDIMNISGIKERVYSQIRDRITVQ